jgi:post-segregation antitoxin (ccd killing protein)
MPVAAVRKTNAVNVSSHAEQGLARVSNRHATCAWCGRDWHSIVDLLDHIEAAHLHQTDRASQAPEIRSTGQV